MHFRSTTQHALDRKDPATSTSQAQAEKQSSSLLVLPFELLTEITAYLANDKAALASLALVNTTFRLFARPLQFHTIYVDAAPEDGGFLSYVTEDAAFHRMHRSEGNHLQNGDLPPLGSHVRHLIVETASDEDRDDESDSEVDGEEPRVILRKAIRRGMPRLHTIQWASSRLDNKLWSMLVGSGLRRLQLHNVIMEQSCWDVDIIPGSMSLERLSMKCLAPDIDELVREYDTEDDEVVRPHLPDIVRAVLKGCAPTLQSLDLSTNLDTLDGIELPCLAELRLNKFYASTGVLSELSRSPLKRLDLTYGSLQNLPEDNTWQLERVDLPDVGPNEDITKAVAFIRQQTKIKSLKVSDYIEGPDFYASSSPNGHIVPLLATAIFSSLTSLSLLLKQAGRYVPGIGISFAESYLMSIGRIESLRQLCLGTCVWGCGFMRPFLWEVDHNSLRRCLAPLVNLEKLAIRYDTYGGLDIYRRRHGPPAWPEEHNRHPTDLWPTESEHIQGFAQAVIDLWTRPILDESLLENDPTRDDTVWIPNDELWGDLETVIQVPAGRYSGLDRSDLTTIVDRNRMLDEADKYATVFPRLGWIFFRQTPMNITIPGHNFKGNAVPLSSDVLREGEEVSILHEIFGAMKAPNGCL